METYKIEHLTFTYPEKQEPVLKDICLDIKKGQFITLCGKSGCGKTTLLRHLKSVLAPHGQKGGAILFEGTPIDELDQRLQSMKIGFVMQSPENQIVTDKVWHELAFGLESLGFDTPTIRLRVAEMASFFGIQTWFYKNVTELSGGQKQLLNLAAIMAMQPSMLILDEPTSQLDPIAASDFLSTVAKINRELGITVLMTEHRLEDVLPLSDRVVVMDKGKVIADGDTKDVGRCLKEMKHHMFSAMPTPMKIYGYIDNDLNCPVTVREGRDWIDSFFKQYQPKIVEQQPRHGDSDTIIELKEVWFRYQQALPDVVKGLSMKVQKGKIYAIVGGNGTGKTTTLSLIAGIYKPYRGEVIIGGRAVQSIKDKEKFNGLLGVLPQNPQSIFVKKTVELDLYEMLSEKSLSREEKQKKVREIALLCELEDLLNQHPYDLSGGEQQRAALAKILLLEPQILLLDEPTKGLDGYFKEKFAYILKRLQAEGITVLLVSHDIEFCASYADCCAMFFDGSIVAWGEPKDFFSGNNFYTTAANRMARHILPEVITVEDLVLACGGTVEENDFKTSSILRKDKDEESKSVSKGERIYRIPKWRKPVALCLLALSIFIGITILNPDLQIAMGDISDSAFSALGSWKYAISILVLALSSGSSLTLLFWGRNRNAAEDNIQTPAEKRKLSKRTLVAAGMILLLIPLTIYIGVFYLDDKKYYFISLLVILETMVPFIMIYEGSKPQARELVVISVLCAIGVAGRAAFFMLPQFKPVVAIVIISAVAFGAETGFLVGAIIGFVSNFFFGQGPWTPWQMFAFGIIGFLAGVLFRKGVLLRTRLSLCIFGGISTFFIYGGIMDPASVLIFQANPKAEMFLTAYLSGLPFNMIHAIATVFFLWVAAPAMLEKLDRIKMKYGLIE